MASLVLGAAVGAVGFMFGGPIGFQLGFMAGSMIGNALTQEKQQGPRLSDLKLQSSAYGQMIPIVYGTIRIAGNVIWQTDLRENSSTSGGKGGGEPEVTTFTYSASFAILLCEGPIVTILRVWADSRLVYDTTAGIEEGSIEFTTYLGTEEQLADPTMQAELGAANVPAYRGRAYVVFTDLDLTEYGNRIPVFTFEIVTNAGAIPWRVSTWDPPQYDPSAGSFGGVRYVGGELIIGIYRSGGAGATSSTYTVTHHDINGVLLSTEPPVNVLNVNGSNNVSSNDIRPVLNHPRLVAMRESAAGTDGVSAWYNQNEVTSAPIYPPVGTDTYDSIRSYPFYYNEYVYALGGLNDAVVSRWPAPQDRVLNTPTHTYDIPSVPASGGEDYFVTVDDKDGHVWVGGNGTGTTSELYHLDADLVLIHAWTTGTTPAQFHQNKSFMVWDRILLFQGPSTPVGAGNPTASAFRINDDFTFTFIGQIEVTDSNLISLGGGLAMVGDGIVSVNPPPVGVPLSEIVEDLSVRAGLTAGQVNVTELTDIVDGYAIASRGPVRPMVEPLQAAYFFNAVESDDKVKFVKRGAASAGTIADEDLAAHAPGEEPPALLQTIHTQEVDLPRIINVEYLNKNADYQEGSQPAQRQVTSSEMAVTVALPIVLTDTKAKQIADALLYDAWLTRDRHMFVTSRKWAKVEPTDIRIVQSRELRIVNKTESGGLIKFEAVPAMAALFTQTAPAGVAAGFTSSVAPIAQLSQLELMDLPLLEDTDSPGFYAAMAGASSETWPGASLFKSTDGTTYASIGSRSTADIIGSAATLLPNFGGGNIVDELSTVDIVIGLGGGTLASVTELAMLNGANEALLGLEIIQFKTATLLATSSYRLTGLLRGRHGTEWAQTYHTIGERFVMLPGLSVAGTELNLLRLYKAVTFGSSLASATAVPLTNRGVALQPYAPVHLGGGHAAGDVTLQWVRRTRIGGAWADFIDVPLSEAVESYVVQIWNSTYTQVARIITTSTPTASYTSAQQVTDFGANQQMIYFSVSQVGAAGLGIEARGTAPGAGGSNGNPLAPGMEYGGAPVGGVEVIPFVSNIYNAVTGLTLRAPTLAVSFTTPTAPRTRVGNLQTYNDFGFLALLREHWLSTVPGAWQVPLSELSYSGPLTNTLTLISVGTSLPGSVRLEGSTLYYLNVRGTNWVSAHATEQFTVGIGLPTS